MLMSLHLHLSVNRASTERQQIVSIASTERQHSVNNVGWGILNNQRATLRHLLSINILTAFTGNRDSDIVTAAS